MPPRILTLTQLRSLPPPSLLDGTHLVSRGLNIIFGPSGMYKSFYTLHQALMIARTLPVVYVAAEGSSGFMKRIDAWCEYHKLPLPDEHLWFIPEEVNLLDSKAMIETTKAIQAKTRQAALVVLDTYARCLLGGDENAAKDTGIAIHQCAMVQRALGGAVALIHHTNKAGASERGSGALRGGADLMIEMNADDEGLIQVKCSKVKDDAAWPQEFYRFYPVGTSGVLEPCDESSLAFITDPLSERQLEILKFLALPVFTEAGARAIQIEKALNLPHKSTFRLLSSLKERSVISQGKSGDPYRISDTGLFELECHRKGKVTQRVNGSASVTTSETVS